MTKSPQTRGFTLVELLVACSVVAILASLTFSVANSAKERAGQARVTTNLRQVTVAMLAFAGENDGRLPGTEGLGLEAGVQDMFVPGEGKGGWGDPRARLGYWVAPYCGVKVEAGASVIPGFSDPLWVSAMKTQRKDLMGTLDKRKWAVSLAVNPVCKKQQFPELTEDFQPFGTSGANGGKDGVPNGTSPKSLATVATVIPPSRVWCLTQADQDLPKVSHIQASSLNASLPKPLFKRNRVTSFFDGSVRLVSVTADMRGPL
jgi:prepilin-type N-terminal cleavage/methylation domain-containing protein